MKVPILFEEAKGVQQRNRVMEAQPQTRVSVPHRIKAIGRGCHPCLRYVLLPMSPGRTTVGGGPRTTMMSNIASPCPMTQQPSTRESPSNTRLPANWRYAHDVGALNRRAVSRPRRQAMSVFGGNSEELYSA